MYPAVRLRRNRKTQWLRDLTAEVQLNAENLIQAFFVIEGENIRQEIDSMPGVFRLSIDQILYEVEKARSKGIKAIALFPSISVDLKSDDADEAYNLDNLICRTVRSIKNAKIDIGIICDVALDPYTKHGHDGILVNGEVDNDKTIAALSHQALTLAKAGVDIIAPSDMMDGRVMAIRETLDAEGFLNVNILAYAAKYNSSFYGPFRDAVGSDKSNYLCKATYQMDFRNAKEALIEVDYDIAEGADMVMIKPAMPYLDVIKETTQNYNTPVFAYQVSGEYAMLKFAALSGALNWEKAIIESLTCIKRAGATAIITYAAIEVAEILNNANNK